MRQRAFKGSCYRETTTSADQTTPELSKIEAGRRTLNATPGNLMLLFKSLNIKTHLNKQSKPSVFTWQRPIYGAENPGHIPMMAKYCWVDYAAHHNSPARFVEKIHGNEATQHL